VGGGCNHMVARFTLNSEINAFHDWSFGYRLQLMAMCIGLIQSHHHVCHKSRTWISTVICSGLFLFVQWNELKGDCSFCWYWWNCWPSLLKLFFPIIDIKLWDKFCQWLVAFQWFSPPIKPTDKIEL
jgi:hypothetical protein